MNLTKKILPIAAIAALAFPGAALAKGPKAKIQFSAGTYAVAENAGTATITVTRSGKAGTPRVTQTATVDYSTTTGGTAVAGSDYTATSGTLSFASGQTSATFTVPIINKDSVDTGPRTINLKLSHPTGTNGAVLGFPSTATLVISDDDASASSGPVLQLASATDTVSEAAGVEKVFVIRSGDLSTTAAINYATADGTAVAGTDYTATSGSLSFPDQATNATTSIIQEVDVPILQNSDTIPTKDFTFALSIPSGGTAQLADPSTKTVTIVNDDNVNGLPVVQWTADSYSIGENGGSVRLTAFISGTVPANGEVDVNYATHDGSALDGVNYTGQADAFQFQAGDVAESVDVPVMADGLQGDKYFTADLTAADPTTGSIGTPGTTTVNLLNTDAAPVDNGSGSGGDNNGGGTTVVDNSTTTNVTNNTTTTDGTQLVLGARQAACGLKVRASHAQKLLKQKVLRLKLRAAQPCKVGIKTSLKQVALHKKAAKGARARVIKGRNAALTLKAGQTRTVTVRFTKKSLAAVKKALRARNKKLVATLVVTTRDSASKVSHKTLKITIRR